MEERRERRGGEGEKEEEGRGGKIRHITRRNGGLPQHHQVPRPQARARGPETSETTSETTCTVTGLATPVRPEMRAPAARTTILRNRNGPGARTVARNQDELRNWALAGKRGALHSQREARAPGSECHRCCYTPPCVADRPGRQESYSCRHLLAPEERTTTATDVRAHDVHDHLWRMEGSRERGGSRGGGGRTHGFLAVGSQGSVHFGVKASVFRRPERRENYYNGGR